MMKMIDKSKTKKALKKRISSGGRPLTWVWEGDEKLSSIVISGRNPMEIVNYDVPAIDVDWWNSVWEFPDINFDRPPFNVFRPVSYDDHPAQFIPNVVEQLIYRFSKKDDLVLDPMAGTGTTLIVARYMQRHSIGVDLSSKYVDIMKARCQFSTLKEDKYIPIIFQGDSMDLKKVSNTFERDSFVDFIIFSPPYFDIKTYDTEDSNQIGDTHNFSEYIGFMEKILRECYRVLKPGKMCCIVVSNVTKAGELIPVAWELGLLGKRIGFQLRPEVIHHTSHSISKAVLRGGQWKKAIQATNPVRTHEYIIVLKK